MQYDPNVSTEAAEAEAMSVQIEGLRCRVDGALLVTPERSGFEKKSFLEELFN